MTPPTVTVAIPLHRSAEWVDNIAANVRALPPMVTEIIISDQTCVDDAAEQLRVRLADDPRVVVRDDAAGLGFVEHYHVLLETAHGDLFMWMPHDDIFDPLWVPMLAQALAEHPRAWLAFGRLEWVQIDGVTPDEAGGKLRFPFRAGQMSDWAALRMMLGGWTGYAFRGLFDRRKVLAAGLRMEPDAAFVGVDREWVFAVALHSALVYNDQPVTCKRAYPGSTSTLPAWRQQHRGHNDDAAIAVLRRHGPGGARGLAMRSMARVQRLTRRGLTQFARWAPSGIRQRGRRAVTRVLGPGWYA
jgi:hypothetical protein